MRTSAGSTASSLALAATYGGDRQLRPDDVEPFLGEAGGVPPWELTDAIDAGDTATALALLARMSGAGGRHPLQLMAVLHGHYARLARLDGVDADVEARRPRLLGISRASRPRRRSSSTGGSAAAGCSGRSTSLPPPTSTCAAPRTCPTTS